VNVRLVLAVVVALLVAGLVLLLWPRQELTPEEEVRAMIAACVTAAEKKDVGAITDRIADDFKGPSGARKQDVKQVLVGQLFRQQDDVAVLNPSLDVHLESQTAATFKGVFVFARPGQDWMSKGSGVSRYDIDGRVEKRADAWLFVSADWHRP